MSRASRISSSHPVKMQRPEHVSQIREDVKAALDAIQEQLKAEEEVMLSALLAAHREVQLSSAVPALCLAAMACPGVTRRMAFQAVAVQTGFHPSHVQRLFYRSRALLGGQPLVLRVHKEKS